jgi:putative ABC transport system permease protein
MRPIRRWLLRLAGLVRRARSARELDDELAAHLQLHIDDNLRRGVAADEARRQALVALGGMTQTIEAHAAQSSVPVLETVMRDVQYALRLMRRNPGFATIVILTLGIGIGANSVMFSVVNSLLLRPLPYANADRLVAIETMEAVRWEVSRTAPPDFYRYRERSRSFDHVEAFYTRATNMTGGREPERVLALVVSPGLFDALGTRMTLGRGFVRQDEQWGSHRVLVLTTGLWERRFGADPSVVGRAIVLDGESFVIVGVLPRSFSFLGAEAQIFVPMAFEAGDNMNTHNNYFLRMIGRLAPGVTRQQATADLNGILQSIVAEQGVNQGMAMDVIPLRNVVVGRDVRRALIVLLAAVGFVLLITCANLANLLLSRAAARQREIGVRLALGASRRRLVSQFLVESVLFSLIGAGMGLAIAYWSADALNQVSQRVLPRAGAIQVDLAVLMFSLAIAVATGLLLGLAPAAYSTGERVGADLRSSSRSSSDSLGRSRFRSILVAAEVALTIVLLTGAGLMIRSMYELVHVPAGFEADGVLTLQLNIPAQKYVNRELDRRSSPLAYTRATAFFTDVVDRIRAVPGARAVGAINGLPLMGEIWGKSVTLYDRPLPADVRGLPSIQYRVVVGDYFKALGIRILSGRPFTDADTLRAPKVAIVNQEFARWHWSGISPLGKVISVNPPLSLVPKSIVDEAVRAGTIPPGYEPDRFTVIGVADDVRYGGLDITAVPLVYVPHAQGSEGTTNMFFVVRTDRDPLSLAAAIRQQVARVDPDQPVASIQPMTARVDTSLAQRRMQMNVLGLFAAMAVLIAVIGIYGVMSYHVAQRAREIGIRLALGAARRDVIAVVMRQGLTMVAIGMAGGLAASAGITRVLRSLLFGVSPTDPLVFSAIAVLLAITAAAAIYVPARRASRLDPLTMLRSD